jgi:hypothetical protein
LSTQATEGKPAINARDRIGNGPWQNFKGEIVAQNIDDLHSDNNKLGSQTSLTERGSQDTQFCQGSAVMPSEAKLPHSSDFQRFVLFFGSMSRVAMCIIKGISIAKACRGKRSPRHRVRFDPTGCCPPEQPLARPILVSNGMDDPSSAAEAPRHREVEADRLSPLIVVGDWAGRTRLGGRVEDGVFRQVRTASRGMIREGTNRSACDQAFRPL